MGRANVSFKIFKPFYPVPNWELWICSRRKRVSDLFICTAITPAAFVIMICSVIAIVLMQGRPVFFRQTRIGRDGKRFTIHKLRTWDKNSKTNVGELLGVLGADETPQILYDIWRGEMAVIGARPLIPKEFPRMRRVLGDERYQEWHRAYIVCRPGWMGAFSQRSRTYLPESREYLLARYKWDAWYRNTRAGMLICASFFAA